MGLYDLPAIINRILAETGRKNLTYVGHSQGTAQLFAAMTLRNEYFRERLNGFIAFGPVTTLVNMKSAPAKKLANMYVDKIIRRLKIFEMFKNTDFIDFTSKHICRFAPMICKLGLNIASGANPDNDDLDRFLVLMSHFPSGTSTKVLAHFADNIRSGTFKEYNSNKLYDLEQIRGIPIALFVGDKDILATEHDNASLVKKLSRYNEVKFYKIYQNIGHVTFFISKDNIHVKDALEQIDNFNRNN